MDRNLYGIDLSTSESELIDVLEKNGYYAGGVDI
jgi:hypothetical protein